MSDHDTFAKRMQFKRTGACPVCGDEPPEQSGEFKVQPLKAHTEYHQFLSFVGEQKPPGLFDPHSPLLPEDVTYRKGVVKLQRMGARCGDTGIGMEMSIGAYLGPKGVPVVLVSEPTVTMSPGTIAAEMKRIGERLSTATNMNRRLINETASAEDAILLMLSGTKADKKRGKRLAKKFLKGR